MKHDDIRPIDPPKSNSRRWRCITCGAVAHSEQELKENETCPGTMSEELERMADALDAKDRWHRRHY